MTNMDTPPKVFVSHGSEDKQRFVEAFAHELRASRVDAWYDRWEIGPGDSMVKRIFEEGIGQAQAVVIVLSSTSVDKPWVKAELETAVVQQITTMGIQLIPIVIDQDVDVPMALRRLRWISAHDLNVAKAAAEVVAHVYNVDRRPPLGSAPAYLTRKLNLMDNAGDDAILNIIAETFAEFGPNTMIRSSLIEEKASRLGISPEAVSDSIYVLHSSGKVRGNRFAGGGWGLTGPSPLVWLGFAASRGIDLDALRVRILADVVNARSSRLDPERYGELRQVVLAVLDEFRQRGLFDVQSDLSGAIAISRVSPLAKRALDQMSSEGRHPYKA